MCSSRSLQIFPLSLLLSNLDTDRLFTNQYPLPLPLSLGGRGGPRRHRAPRRSADGAPAPLVSASTDFPIKYG